MEPNIQSSIPPSLLKLKYYGLGRGVLSMVLDLVSKKYVVVTTSCSWCVMFNSRPPECMIATRPHGLEEGHAMNVAKACVEEKSANLITYVTGGICSRASGK